MTLKKEILHLVDIIAVPAEVFRDLHSEPRWRFALVFLAFISVVTGWWMIPAVLEPMRRIFESTFSGGTADAGIAGARVYVAFVEMGVDPVSHALRWIIVTSGIVIFSPLIGGEHVRFKNIFSIVAYGETIFNLERVLTVLIIYAKGISTIENEYSLSVFKGLEWFFVDRNHPAVVITFLSNINPFSIWYITTISIGIGIAGGMRRAKTITLSVIAWLVWMVCALVGPYLGQLIIHLLF